MGSILSAALLGSSVGMSVRLRSDPTNTPVEPMKAGKYADEFQLSTKLRKSSGAKKRARAKLKRRA